MKKLPEVGALVRIVGDHPAQGSTGVVVGHGLGGKAAIVQLESGSTVDVLRRDSWELADDAPRTDAPKGPRSLTEARKERTPRTRKRSDPPEAPKK